MVFKLVRIDSQDPSKIQLSIGTHVIGRGKFLHNDETDKRVSRNHAELEVTTDTVHLKSLHQNPCFFIKKSIETHLLQQDATVNLSHGDKFGLLPDHFWYEVLHCPGDDTPVEETVTPELTVNGIHNERKQYNGEREQDNVTPEIGAAPEEEEEPINFEADEDDGLQFRSASPSLLPPEQEDSNQEPIGLEPVESEATEQYEVPPQLPSGDVSSPAKRSHSSRESSPLDVKRVKTERSSTSEDASTAAGPSNAQASPDTDRKDNVAAAASPAKPRPSRERCIYGANCYRRNPQHKAQFSHPQDADWGGGERGECPYGRACTRRDPRHWTHHTHPPGTMPPAQRANRPGMQVVERNGNVFYINAHSVNFYDDHFQVEDSDGDSVDYDYEF